MENNESFISDAETNFVIPQQEVILISMQIRYVLFPI